MRVLSYRVNNFLLSGLRMKFNSTNQKHQHYVISTGNLRSLRRSLFAGALALDSGGRAKKGEREKSSV